MMQAEDLQHGAETTVEHPADAAHPEGLQSPEFHVALGFFIFVGLLLWFGVHKMIAKALDDRSARIAAQIEEARALRDEAQSDLAHKQRSQREIEDDADSIIAQAEEDSRLLLTEAMAEIERLSERRRQLADQKINRAEQAALKAVRGQAAAIAIAAARKVIADELSGARGEAIVDDAIKALPKRAN